MRHPSIRFRLIIGTSLFVALVLALANLAIYDAFRRTLWKEVDRELLQNASMLAKSAELKASSLDYEWQEAMRSPAAPRITGVFQFWDMNSSRVTKSPDLGDRELPLIYGSLNEPRLKDIVLTDGRRARAVGLLHHPFVDDEAIRDAKALGIILKPEDHPQVVVCVRETESLVNRLAELKGHLIRAAIGTLIAIVGSIFVISTWCLRPIRSFSDGLLKRADQGHPPVMEIPRQLPRELIGLAAAFNSTLDRVEKSRNREREFALHAAHELRTPVAGILATLEQAIHRPRDSEELNQRIHQALEIVTGMRLTLDSLMRLARLRGGLEGSVAVSFDPLEIVRTQLAAHPEIIARRQLEVTVDFPATAGSFTSDPGLFRAIISNLIDNALRHSPASGTVRFRIVDSPEQFRFESTNSTNTLLETDLKRWFEPFQRGAEGADDESGHAGLGLSLARAAATLLGGEIQARINSDKTIVFIASVPRRGAHER